MTFVPSLLTDQFTLSFPHHPGVLAWVTVGGKPLEVHSSRVGFRKCCGFVEAVGGAPFVVHWADLRKGAPSEGYEVVLFVDGVDCNGTVTARDDSLFSTPLDSEERVTSYEGKEDLNGKIRSFSFSRIRPVGADASSANKDYLENVGTISLRYYRVDTILETGVHVVSSLPSTAISEEDKVPHITHQTAFGVPVVSNTLGPLIRFRRLDKKSKPLCEVEFKYRSKEVLQLEGLLPADPIKLPADVPPPPPPRFSTDELATAVEQDVADLRLSSSHLSATPDPPPSHHPSPAAQSLMKKLKRKEQLLAMQKELEAVKAELKEVKEEEEDEKWERDARARAAAAATAGDAAGEGYLEVYVKDEEVNVGEPVPPGTGTGEEGEVEVLELDV